MRFPVWKPQQDKLPVDEKLAVPASTSTRSIVFPKEWTAHPRKARDQRKLCVRGVGRQNCQVPVEKLHSTSICAVRRVFPLHLPYATSRTAVDSA
jgi:hypothetical protein